MFLFFFKLGYMLLLCSFPLNIRSTCHNTNAVGRSAATCAWSWVSPIPPTKILAAVMLGKYS